MEGEFTQLLADTENFIVNLLQLFGIVGTLIICSYVLLKVEEMKVRVSEVHHATNSMKDELVAVTAKSSRAEGLAAGVLQEQRDQKEKNYIEYNLHKEKEIN